MSKGISHGVGHKNSILWTSLTKKGGIKDKKEDAFNAAMIRQLFQWAISNDISGNQNLKMKWRRRIFKSIKRGLLQVLAHYVNRYVENCSIFYALFSSIWWRGKFYSKNIKIRVVPFFNEPKVISKKLLTMTVFA